MHFGLSNAPSVFQTFINKVFRDMLGWGVVVYIDNVLVYSSDHVQHVSLVRSVLRRLLEHDLYVKQEKSLFFHRSVSHRHGRSGDGGATSQRSQVMAHPQFHESSPAIPGVLQIFSEVHPRLQHSGRTSYLPAERRSPAASLDGGEGVRDAEGTFHYCSRVDTSRPPSLPFIVEVDDSEVGAGAVLSQRTGTPPKMRPALSTPSS